MPPAKHGSEKADKAVNRRLEGYTGNDLIRRARPRRGQREEIDIPLSVRREIHRNSVDAVAKMGRRRAVVKDVPEMASTIRAMDLGSDHAKGSINGCLDGTLNRIIEAGPAGAAFEFPFRFK
jgi:hypothetical protein